MEETREEEVVRVAKQGDIVALLRWMDSDRPGFMSLSVVDTVDYLKTLPLEVLAPHGVDVWHVKALAAGLNSFFIRVEIHVGRDYALGYRAALILRRIQSKIDVWSPTLRRLGRSAEEHAVTMAKDPRVTIEGL